MPVQDIVNSFDDLAKQTITFVGDQTSFSDMYLRFVKSEFADVDVVIEPNLEAAKKIHHLSDRACKSVDRFGPRCRY